MESKHKPGFRTAWWFVKETYTHWVPIVTGVLSVIVGAVAFQWSDAAKPAFYVLLFLALLVAPYLAWLRRLNEVQSLLQQLDDRDAKSRADEEHLRSVREKRQVLLSLIEEGARLESHIAMAEYANSIVTPSGIQPWQSKAKQQVAKYLGQDSAILLSQPVTLPPRGRNPTYSNAYNSVGSTLYHLRELVKELRDPLQ